MASSLGVVVTVDVVEVDFENAAHCAGVVEVIDSYAADPVGGGRPLDAGARERLVPLLREHPSTIVLVALAEEAVMGVAVCVFGISTFRARPVLNVADLAVLPWARARGVGRALLAGAEELARARGCCRLTLEVQDDNARALGLYRSFGFADFVVGDSGPTRFLTKSLET